jgi:hypothetical protein
MNRAESLERVSGNHVLYVHKFSIQLHVISQKSHDKKYTIPDFLCWKWELKDSFLLCWTYFICLHESSIIKKYYISFIAFVD